MCFSRTLRHPGESYIDYVALVDSIRVRRERLLEEELWRCFRQFSEPSENSDPADGASDGRLPASRVEAFLQVSDLQEALSRDGVQDCERFATDVQQAIRLGSENVAGSPEVDFIDVVSELIRQLPLWPIQPTAKERVHSIH